MLYMTRFLFYTIPLKNVNNEYSTLIYALWENMHFWVGDGDKMFDDW